MLTISPVFTEAAHIITMCMLFTGLQLTLRQTVRCERTSRADVTGSVDDGRPGWRDGPQPDVVPNAEGHAAAAPGSLMRARRTQGIID